MNLGGRQEPVLEKRILHTFARVWLHLTYPTSLLTLLQKEPTLLLCCSLLTMFISISISAIHSSCSESAADSFIPSFVALLFIA